MLRVAVVEVRIFEVSFSYGSWFPNQTFSGFIGAEAEMDESPYLDLPIEAQFNQNSQ